MDRPSISVGQALYFDIFCPPELFVAFDLRLRAWKVANTPFQYIGMKMRLLKLDCISPSRSTAVGLVLQTPHSSISSSGSKCRLFRYRLWWPRNGRVNPFGRTSSFSSFRGLIFRAGDGADLPSPYILQRVLNVWPVSRSSVFRNECGPQRQQLKNSFEILNPIWKFCVPVQKGQWIPIHPWETW